MRWLGWGAALAAILGVAIAPRAHAFCGFYVDDGSVPLKAPATSVVLMRDGTRTVLSMQNDYEGPPEDFAMVVPVPVAIGRENVKVLPRDVLTRVEDLAAPRLVEYWQAAPECPEPGFGFGGLGMSGIGYGGGGSVHIEARFEVGEYDVVILGASDSAGLERWLVSNGYRIPAGAEALLRPYVASGSYFFVAKVDSSRVTFEGTRARLSPLRIHYDSDRFTLPVRLGLVNSSGRQDLLVHILAADRYEAANFPNVTIPTNLEVAAAVRGRFADFYDALFERVTARNPGAVVTEYAWSAASCDPCPGPTLSGTDVTTLGADVTPSSPMTSTRPGGLRVGRVERIRGEGDSTGLDREIARTAFTTCRLGDVARQITVEIEVGSYGRVTHVTPTTDDAFSRCVAERIRGSTGFSVIGGRRASTRGVSAFRVQIAAEPPVPVRSRTSAIGLTLTRLHVRYDASTLRDDLVFRVASPIEGGVDTPDDRGHLQRGAHAANASTFQARYAILHRWTRRAACRDPIIGAWGGPPGGRDTDRDAVGAARRIGRNRAAIDLPSLIRQSVPELGIVPTRVTAPRRPSSASSPPTIRADIVGRVAVLTRRRRWAS